MTQEDTSAQSSEAPALTPKRRARIFWLVGTFALLSLGAAAGAVARAEAMGATLQAAESSGFCAPSTPPRRRAPG